MAGGSKLNDYIDDSFKANSDDDDDDEIEEPKLLPHSLFTVAVGRCLPRGVQRTVRGTAQRPLCTQ